MAAFGGWGVKPGKRGNIRGTFGAGKGVYLSDELRGSAAFQSLTSVEKWILADFVRKHYRVSGGDKTDIGHIGFPFTIKDAMELCDAKTFYRARARIVAVGFFDARPDLKKVMPGAWDMFTPSRRWRDFIPDVDAARRIQKRQARRAEYVERGASRKRDFVRRRGGDADG